MSEKPIFLDESGRRRRIVTAIAVLLIAILTVLVGAFAVSVWIPPLLPGDPVRVRASGPLPPLVEVRQSGWLRAKERAALVASARRPALVRPVGPKGAFISAAYFSPDQETGVARIDRYGDRLTHVMPVWWRVGRDGGLDSSLASVAENPRNADFVTAARKHGLRIVPTLQNFRDDAFRPDLARKAMDDPRFPALLVDWVTSRHCAGVSLDFENLEGQDRAAYAAFAERVREAMHARGLECSAAVEADAADAGRLARSVDYLVVMAYDEHSEEGEPGPIASEDWVRASVERMARSVPADKLVLGIGGYALDWTVGSAGPAASRTFEEAISDAKGYRPDESPEAVIKTDPDSGNRGYVYRDDADRLHKVWMLDGGTAYESWRLLRELGLRGGALWAVGEEDPSVWTVFSRDPARVPDPKRLAIVPGSASPEFVGRGEVLRVRSEPATGRREVDVAPDGNVDDLRYVTYPSPYLLEKSGFRPKKLALTFDDGPDRDWTPAILDELKRLRVPATFFVIGANAEGSPDLVRRMFDEGHDVGSHTFTHPNLGTVSDRRVELELATTQRAIQAILGRSTVLFRPPYNADSEPKDASEVRPIAIASREGYVTVGENVDPQDWNLVVRTERGTRAKTGKDIAGAVEADLRRRARTDDEGNVVLLHDAGGDRSATIDALRRMVPRLRAEGYTFVTTSELLGRSRDRTMPPVPLGERLLVGLDRIGFRLAFGAERLLGGAFVLAVVLGLARLALILPLAIRHRRRPVPGSGPLPNVSALVAAYNEETGIVPTIRSILASDVVPEEVIVVDDGSKDGTAAAVEAAFAGDPRVILIRKPNGGKASALNVALARASGEVAFCVDADTQIDPAAIGRLVAPLREPAIGAVAGNVRVGNVRNAVTTWQSVEYTTSQNLDRAAYAALNAVTVVPGAIGAWRISAVRDVGGYETDTLAEDMDLTWRVRMAGYRIETVNDALAFTEAPETLSAFFKQRFRWAYGTLQCLWKHRSALGRYGAFGRFALPCQWAFQVVFQVLAPLIDLQMLVSLVGAGAVLMATRGENSSEAAAAAMDNLRRTGWLYLTFTLAEIGAGLLAYRWERRSPRELVVLPFQKIVYRQLMYGVIWKSLGRAITGARAGWGKLRRTGTVRVG